MTAHANKPKKHATHYRHYRPIRVAVIEPWRFLVQQYKQKPNYTVAYSFAARLFDSAFAACERLPDADRELLLKEIESRIMVVLHSNQTPEPIRVLGIEIKQADSVS